MLKMHHEPRPGPAVVVLHGLEYPESAHMMRQQDWDDAWRRALGFLRRNLYRK